MHSTTMHDVLSLGRQTTGAETFAGNASDDASTDHALTESTSIGISTFEQVRDKVRADDKGKWDMVLPRSEVLMRSGRIHIPDGRAHNCEDGLILSRWAMGQICQRLNIPTSYFRRCPAQLKDVQFNHWNSGGNDGDATPTIAGLPEELDDITAEANGFSDRDCTSTGGNLHGERHNGERHNGERHNGEPSAYANGWSCGSHNGHRFQGGIYAGTEKSEYWLLRAKDQTLRAVLTDKYTPLDNRTLVDALSKSLPSHLQVQWLAIDNESFHLRLIDPSLSQELFPGDPVMAGIHISNSETGCRSVTVDSLLYRQVCTNGMIRLYKNKSILSQRHVAVSPHHFTALLRQALPMALSVATALSEQMVWSTQVPLGDVETEIKNLMQHWHLSQGFVEQVQGALGKERSEQQETVFGLVNAVTQAAQTLDIEARYEMEVLAGKLLERKLTQYGSGNQNGHAVRVPVAQLNGSHASVASSHVSSSNLPNSKASEAVEAAEVLFEADRVQDDAVPLQNGHTASNGAVTDGGVV